MNNETAVTTTTGASIVPTENNNFELSASSPPEMVQCHQAAIGWCRNKIQTLKGEVNELKLAYEHAKKSKWSWQALKKHWTNMENRVVFYEKMLAAFEAGYYIVPNFPVTLFAIKTTDENPKRMWARLNCSHYQNFEQPAKVLPVGEGEYQNPQPVVKKEYWSHQSDEKKGDTWGFYAEKWDTMEFPCNMSRIHVMEAATQAMDLKIFDEVGFLPQDYKRNPDPILIGHLIDPRSTTYNKRTVSFLIAWHIDSKNL